MARFVTFTTYENEDVQVLTHDQYRSLIPDQVPDWDEWIWQEAPDPDTAIAQHETKLDEWRADLDEGRPEKFTY